MSISSQPSTPERRERATSRLRFLTRGAVVAATGATVAMGFVVAHEQPGGSATRTTTTTSPGGGSSTSGTSDSGDSGTAGTTGTTGTTGDTGNTGTSTTQPTATDSRPTVTSGGTSR